MKESELAAAVIEHLEAEGWETWQEVTLPDEGRADIVARQPPVVWIVETKTTLSLDLIEQAYARTRYAHLVSVAVPRTRERRRFAERILGQEGVGLLDVGPVPQNRWDTPRVMQQRRPLLHRRIDSSWLPSLCERHKTALAAGSRPGGQWTPFRQTCDNAASYVQRYPGCSIRDLFDNIDHHYYTVTSARTAFVKRIEQGIVPGLEMRREGKKLTIWPRAEVK